jgi:predicted secreted protein
VKHIIILVAVAVVAAILFASCSKSKNGASSNQNPSSGNFVDVDGKSNGRTIEAHTGDIIRITLESNITTGYDWQNADKVDQDILKLDKNDYVSDPNPEELDGVGGKTVIVYRALKPGKARIDLAYMRAWEPDADDIEKFSMTVEVLDRP